ncbi:hypothetical protein NQ317_004264 [Molorchus minor]|uniref:Glycoprotein n=1 Tax=Molorchus minor TaxID=1323400 RepID=A0ABQ9JZ40_9CUCU|nr:hypothetical protein NQ317_004264 [Molorchus minor]
MGTKHIKVQGKIVVMMLREYYRGFFVEGNRSLAEQRLTMGPRFLLDLMLVMVLGTWIPRVYEVTGLIAYDCGDDNVDITAISLRNVARCPDPSSAYASESVDVTVLQRNDVGLRHVWSCLVEITRLITYCGMHSHSSVVAGGLLNYIYQVGSEECRQIHRYRTLKLYQQTIGGIVLNGTTTESVTLFGSLQTDGTCRGISYQENGKSWDNVVVAATVKIQVNDYFATVRLKENEISLKRRSESTWDFQAQIDCQGHLSLLYEGKAEKVTNVQTKEQYMVVNQESKIFAVTIIKKIQLCSLEVWQTEHPKLLIVEGHIRAFPISAVLLPQNTDLTLYVNSKFLYIEQAYKRDLESLYIDTIHRRCLLQREILKNRLLLAPVVPDAVSQIIQDKEGYVGHVLGEVLYILRCIPKNVQIRRTENCYQELPIRVDNQSKFMAPITRIIQDFGEEIQCNGITPPLYNIEGDWIGLTPHPTQKHPPKELEAMSGAQVKFQPIQPLGSKGLYTPDEIEKVQKLLTFGQERKVVENIIARRAAGMETGGQGFSTLGIFDPKEMKELARSTMKEMWGWFTDLGIFISGLTGFYFIFRIVKYLFGVAINGLHLYQTVGGGIALLACLWNTLTMWVIHRHHMEEGRASRDVVNEREELETIASVSESVAKEQSAVVYPDLNAVSHWTEKLKN